MMRFRSAVLLPIALLTFGVTAVPAAAASVVLPGQSIQAAIDAAAPGTTVRIGVGTFRESLVIVKQLTLRGAGAGDRGTVLLPPATLPVNACIIPNNGICVAGDPTARVRDVTITGFLVRGYSGSGVIGFGTERLQVGEVEADDNLGYGIASFEGLRSRLHDNRVRNNGEAGVYVGDSPDAGAVVSDNIATGNGFGLFLRDSTNIVAGDNRATGNCIGILALNTGHGATPAGNFRIHDNDTRANNKVCPASDEGPPTSGLGIALAGTHDVIVNDNQVTDNRPGGPSLVPGGISVFSTESFGGAAPVRNTVRDNTVLRNEPVDLFSDGSGSGNRFRENRCRTSQPAGLCGSRT